MGQTRTDRLAVRIRGTGHVVPAKRLTNADLERMIDTSDEWIRTRTGICERRIVSENESTLTLALESSRRAIADADIETGEIDLIICATITPEVPFPATACFLQRELGLGLTGVPSFDISAACSGFVYALIVAAQFVHGGEYRNALVVGAEAMSRLTDYEERGTCILMGDGAAAAVISPAERDQEGIFHRTLGADGNGTTWIWVPAGGARTPASHMTVNERLHYMKMDGREVYKFAVTKMKKLVQAALADAGLTIDDLALLIPHQSNLRIIESVSQRLGLPPEKVYVNIDRLGNTSAASVPIALDEARRSGRVKSGDWVLLVAIGAGLTWGVALVRL